MLGSCHKKLIVMYHLLTCSMLVITDQHAPSLKIELDFITAWYCDTVKYFRVQMNLVISRISWTTAKVRFFFSQPPHHSKSSIQLPGHNCCQGDPNPILAAWSYYPMCYFPSNCSLYHPAKISIAA